jgi:hypothetical protein
VIEQRFFVSNEKMVELEVELLDIYRESKEVWSNFGDGRHNLLRKKPSNGLTVRMSRAPRRHDRTEQRARRLHSVVIQPNAMAENLDYPERIALALRALCSTDCEACGLVPSALPDGPSSGSRTNGRTLSPSPRPGMRDRDAGGSDGPY